MVTLGVMMADSTNETRFKKILRSIFSLTNSQVECFEKIRQLGQEGTCVQNLAIQSESERSVEQKKLKILLKKGLIVREALSLSDFQHRCSLKDRDDLAPGTKKGYLYIYRTITDEELLEKLNQTTQKWASFMQSHLSQTVN